MKKKPKKRVKYWVLRWSREPRWLSADRHWFMRATKQKAKAARFKTEHDAMQHPAYYHAFSLYEPEAVR